MTISQGLTESLATIGSDTEEQIIDDISFDDLNKLSMKLHINYFMNRLEDASIGMSVSTLASHPLVDEFCVF
jgi:hypothetical protein